MNGDSKYGLPIKTLFFKILYYFLHNYEPFFMITLYIHLRLTSMENMIDFLIRHFFGKLYYFIHLKLILNMLYIALIYLDILDVIKNQTRFYIKSLDNLFKPCIKDVTYNKIILS
jgi:hypothetical protein